MHNGCSLLVLHTSLTLTIWTTMHWHVSFQVVGWKETHAAPDISRAANIEKHFPVFSNQKNHIFCVCEYEGKAKGLFIIKEFPLPSETVELKPGTEAGTDSKACSKKSSNAGATTISLADVVNIAHVYTTACLAFFWVSVVLSVVELDWLFPDRLSFPPPSAVLPVPCDDVEM